MLNVHFCIDDGRTKYLLLYIFSTVRDGDTVKHYRIRQLDEGGFFIARRTTFR